jgi:hypothetical protein
MDAQPDRNPHMDLKEAHRFSIRHRAQVENSATCGCFYCLTIFPPTEIVDWTDDDQTALCPKCRIDSVLGSASGAPITADFLSLMRAWWFEKSFTPH